MATGSLFFPLLLFSLFFSLLILPHSALQNTTVLSHSALENITTLQCIALGQPVLNVTSSPLPGSLSGHGFKEVPSCECECLAIVFLLLLLAPMVSSWVSFYDSSSMVIGILLVIIILLFEVRRARRALKGLVKMQALVRGHIIWKRIAGWMHQIQVLMRAQNNPQFFSASSRGGRSRRRWDLSRRDLSIYSSHPNLEDQAEDGVFCIAENSPQFFLASSREGRSRRRWDLSKRELSIYSSHPNLEDQAEDSVSCTAENSLQFFSASSRAGRSRRRWDLSRRDLSIYSSHPNYMAPTESSRAKVRSLNAPKQRL